MSVHIQQSFVVERPVDSVWAFMDDLSNYPLWVPGLAEVRLVTPGPKRVGSQMLWVYPFLGRRLDVTIEITAYEAPRRFASIMRSGPLLVRGTWLYEPVGTGTRITMDMEGETGGVFRIADSLVARAIERQSAASYGTLKDLLETALVAA